MLTLESLENRIDLLRAKWESLGDGKPYHFENSAPIRIPSFDGSSEEIRLYYQSTLIGVNENLIDQIFFPNKIAKLHFLISCYETLIKLGFKRGICIGLEDERIYKLHDNIYVKSLLKELNYKKDQVEFEENQRWHLSYVTNSRIIPFYNYQNNLVRTYSNINQNIIDEIQTIEEKDLTDGYHAIFILKDPRASAALINLNLERKIAYSEENIEKEIQLFNIIDWPVNPSNHWENYRLTILRNLIDHSLSFGNNVLAYHFTEILLSIIEDSKQDANVKWLCSDYLFIADSFKRLGHKSQELKYYLRALDLDVRCGVKNKIRDLFKS